MVEFIWTGKKLLPLVYWYPAWPVCQMMMMIMEWLSSTTNDHHYRPRIIISILFQMEQLMFFFLLLLLLNTRSCFMVRVFMRWIKNSMLYSSICCYVYCKHDIFQCHGTVLTLVLTPEYGKMASTLVSGSFTLAVEFIWNIWLFFWFLFSKPVQAISV